MKKLRLFVPDYGVFAEKDVHRRHIVVGERAEAEGIATVECAPSASVEALSLVHTPEYVEALKTGEPCELASTGGDWFAEHLHEATSGSRESQRGVVGKDDGSRGPGAELTDYQKAKQNFEDNWFVANDGKPLKTSTETSKPNDWRADIAKRLPGEENINLTATPKDINDMPSPGERVNMMGREKKWIETGVVFSGLVLIAILIFPPWNYTHQSPGISQVRKSAGYAFLFKAPNPERNRIYDGVAIDVTRLFVEILVLLTATGVPLYILKNRSKTS